MDCVGGLESCHACCVERSCGPTVAVLHCRRLAILILHRRLSWGVVFLLPAGFRFERWDGCVGLFIGLEGRAGEEDVVILAVR